jgi:tripartite-type tricarboxylate transporter receptor subunit TctC
MTTKPTDFEARRLAPGDTTRRDAIRLLCIATAAGLSRAALAQDLPPTLRIVVPFAAGGPLDNSARLLAEGIAQVAGRTVIVENKPGAAGVIAASEVARARPDGSTLLYITGGHTTTPALQAKLPFDPLGDFTPVTQLTISPGFLLLVPASSPYRSAAQLIEAAKAKPGTLSYGSAGNGNTTHLVGALFARAAQIDLIHVPYKGSAPIVTDMLGGQLTMTFLGGTIGKPYIDSGRLRALAIAGDERSREFPDVPSFAELGLRGVDVPAWSGLLAPKGLPQPVLQRLHEAIQAAVKSPAYAADAARQGARVVVNPPAQFAAYMDGEIRRYKEQLAPLNIRMD